MPVTIGEFEYSLDAKNRLAVPPRFRAALEAEKGAHFFLAKGFDGCLMLLLPSQWEDIQRRMTAQAERMKDKVGAQDMLRDLFRSGTEAPLDVQGRILVPNLLKERAGLAKDVVIIGAGNRAEIWDRARWQQYSKRRAEPAFAKMRKDFLL